MNELTLAAKVENIEKVTKFVEELLSRYDCSPKARIQIDVAIDELFGNIAQYAYYPEEGTATVQAEVTKDPLTLVLTFIDHGVPYNPLEQKDPDITLSADERGIGGLGIYMVKKTMDGMVYEYKDGRNILRIEKILQ